VTTSGPVYRKWHRADSGVAAGATFRLGRYQGPDGRARIGESEKVHNRLDEFEHLLFRFIAFGRVRRQPLAAGRQQPFEGIAYWRIGIKVSGNQPNSSVISIRCRLVIAANGIAQTIEQGVEEKPIGRGHTENPAECA
jgi:hypothetical protein